MPGARCTRSLVWGGRKPHELAHYRFSRFTRHSPRNGFNDYFALSPECRA
jgi:hypothetical protein